jgi:adenylyltransferase/sulfurtransferase
MLSPKEKEHYKRHLLLPEIGREGQERLKASKLLIVGAGGLGCPAAQYLTAAGVGQITLIDFDKVDQSNLQRQVLFGIEQLGENKAEAAAHRLRKLNPHITITPLAKSLNPSNAMDLLSKHDLVIDGTDNFATRYLINDAATITNRPYVYGSVQKFEGQVSVFNFQNGPTYRCLFPEPPAAGTVPNCAEQGVLGVLPGIIGTMQAAEALKIILGIGGVLSGQLLVYNALSCMQYKLEIKRNERIVADILSNANGFEHRPFLEGGCASIPALEPVQLLQLLDKQGHNILLIDVREEGELPQHPFEGHNVIQYPLSSLEKQVPSLPLDKEVVLFCRSGQRTLRAAQLWQARELTVPISHLKGGLMAWETSVELIYHGSNTQ